MAKYKLGQSIANASDFCDDVLGQKNDCFESIHTFNEKFMIDFTTRPSVYFLINNEQIIYIGQTIHLLKRLTEHIYHNDKSKRKSFNSFKYIFTDTIETAKEIEGTLISRLRPPLNKTNGSLSRVVSDALGISECAMHEYGSTKRRLKA